MKKIKKLTLGISLAVLLATAAVPVQAAIKVSNSYSSSGYGSIVSLKNFKFSYPTKTTTATPAQTTPTQTAPTQPTTPTQTAPTQPTTPTQTTPTQTTPTQTAPTQTTPTQPAPTQPTTPTQTTPSQTTPSTPVSTQEQAMIDAINKERAAAGLSPLKVELRLVNVAQLKANDMKTNGYFSHTSPTYGTPFEMMRSFGIQYRYAGENIARNMSVDAAMAAFMNSEGHRKNILNPAYTHVGVGVVSSSSGNYYVQIFAQM